MKLFEKLTHVQKHRSMLYADGEKTVRDFLEEVFPGRRDLMIIECGTNKGVSASIFSQYGHVITVDIERQSDIEETIEAAGGVRQRILTNIYPERSARMMYLDGSTSAPFDLGFEDASHFLPDIQDNFQYLKRCGLVLFHDYDGSQPGVTTFLDRLSETDHVIRRGVFGVWIKKNHPFALKLFGDDACLKN